MCPHVVSTASVCVSSTSTSADELFCVSSPKIALSVANCGKTVLRYFLSVSFDGGVLHTTVLLKAQFFFRSWFVRICTIMWPWRVKIACIDIFFDYKSGAWWSSCEERVFSWKMKFSNSGLQSTTESGPTQRSKEWSVPRKFFPLSTVPIFYEKHHFHHIFCPHHVIAAERFFPQSALLICSS